MAPSWQARRDIVVYLATAVAIGWNLLKEPSWLPLRVAASDRSLEIAATASVPAFLCAAIVMFYRRHIAPIVALPAGLAALAWFVRTELVLTWWNSWVLLNYESEDGESLVSVAIPRILAALLLVMAIVCSVLRLFSIPRIWPAFAVGLPLGAA